MDMLKKVLFAAAPFVAGMLIAGCSSEALGYRDYALPGEGYYAEDAAVGDVGGGGGGGGESGGNGNTSAGIVTAGEWRDLDHWSFWSSLMTGEEFSGMKDLWKMYPDNLVAVHATDAANKPVIGAKVVLFRNGTAVWTTKTDNKGFAYLWVSPFQPLNDVSADELTVNVGGTDMTGHPEISTWHSQSEIKINEYQKLTADAQPVISNMTDIAFIVDATGSMDDEISFLKDDLVDILGKASAKAGSEAKLRTAAVFYRDEGDKYVTKTDDFKTDYTKTVAFIKDQEADGGGDYPEAVHTALEVSLQNLSWGEDSRMRVAFLLLDAPAHSRPEVKASLQKSIETFARLGIRIVPIAASGADKDTEFMLRFFDVLTGGTYTFLTNDSGVGGEHIAASVGEFEVERLNDLIVRLIADYLS